MTRQELTAQIFKKRNYLCIGLDTDATRIPQHLLSQSDPVFDFNRRIIDATLDFCVSYKINTAFYEAMGLRGWEAMAKTIEYIPSTHFKIADAKRGDIGNTSAQYAKAFFEQLNFDAITVAPYMGEDSVKPFLEYQGRWTILLGLTSNSGASDFELQRAGDQYLYEKVIQTAAAWGTEENLMFVVGATQANEFTRIRELAPNHFYLVPGVGVQGGSLQEISKKALIPDCGLLVNVSRAIIYASKTEDFADEASLVAQQYSSAMSVYLG